MIIRLAHIILLTISWNLNTFQEPLIENTARRTFSDLETKDTFSIQLTGNSISEGTVSFTIRNNKDELIFEEKFPSTYLIGYGLIEIKDPTIEQEEQYIRKRVSEFFNEDNFIQPAIEETDEFDSDYSIQEDWIIIKSDQTSVGFYYLVGEGAGCRIAYSKKLKRTIKYFCCC
jgi:hypothetical protein